MKILIVDDNMTNRMMLQALLDNFAKENNLVFDLDEALDGQEAVNKCKDTTYSMVLMDINMPNMNGIEASRIIREVHPKVMIIAVSTSDDIEQRRAILNNGAEDYISKPIDADVFKTRMKNYMSLLEVRQHKSALSSRFINLYSNEIYSRHTTFILDSEDAIAEFWEFFLLKARAKSNYLSDIVRAVVAIVEKQIKIAPTNKLYIEESESKQYFTLTNIDVLPAKVLELILRKNEITQGYKLSSSKISFELHKAKQYEDSEVKSVAIETSKKEEESHEVKIIETKEDVIFESSQALEVLDYMDADDLFDLEEYIKKLSSIMLIVGYGDVTQEEVIEIYTNLDRVSSILSSYSEVYTISVGLSALSSDMSTHIDEFTSNSEALGPMCKAFSTDLSNWVEQSFHTGAPSADFMNDTIAVNCQTIGGMLKMDEEAPVGDDDFDDIFDF